MPSSQSYQCFSKTTAWPFCDQSTMLNNTWNYAVAEPLSNGESHSSLSCSYQKLFAIKHCPVTFGPPCIYGSYRQISQYRILLHVLFLLFILSVVVIHLFSIYYIHYRYKNEKLYNSSITQWMEYYCSKRKFTYCFFPTL